MAQADADPSDVNATLGAADYELTSGEIDAALGRLLAALRRIPSPERDPIRDRLVEYFELLGPDDPRVGPARRDLTQALF